MTARLAMGAAQYTRPPAEHGAHYRPDVDGLRAVAVSAVIVYHYFDDFVPSGFLGVDVFFVISGYVITAYLSRAPKDDWCSFLLNFYARRARRILPALALCVVVTALAFLSVASRPPNEAFATGGYALIGVSNAYLLLNAQDYFALDSGLNPFTHTWSLGVEEQFYFLYPALVLLFGYSPKGLNETRLLVCLLIGSALSLFLFVTWSASNSLLAFYLMPARFWELALGGIAYFAISRVRLPSSLANIAVLGLFASFTMPGEWQVGATLLAAACTAFLIMSIAPSQRLYAVLSARPVNGMGLISYSLYLWHWPVLVVGRWSIGNGNGAILTMMIATALLAIASYRLVEIPIRYGRWPRSSARTLGLSFASVAACFVGVTLALPPLASQNNSTLAGLFGIKEPDDWRVGVPCNGAERVAALQHPMAECILRQRTAAKPSNLYLIGDSHAGHLYNMAVDAAAAGPFAVRFLNAADPEDFPRSFLRSSNPHSQLLDAIVADAQKGDVLAIALHRGRFNAKRDRHVPLAEDVQASPASNRFTAAMEPYVHRLRGKGVEIVLIQDTPLMGVVASSAACALQIKLFGESVCRVSREQDHHTRARQDAAFAHLSALSDHVKLWDPSVFMFSGRDFIDVVDESNAYIMADWNHITTYQSRKLAEPFREFLFNLNTASTNNLSLAATPN